MKVHQVEIRRLSDLINHIVNVIGRPPHHQMWFRGHEDASWKLTASVHREAWGSGEGSIATEFMLEAPVRYASCPERSEHAAWLLLMQHYGLPTRLLDWTLSPLIAAYFAVAHQRDCASAVWGLFPYQLNKQVYDSQWIWPLSQYEVAVAPVFDHKAPPYEGVAAVAGEVIDLRMLVQQSRFTIHGTSEPLEDWKHLKEEDSCLVKYLIPKESGDDIMTELELLGMSKRYLFPDLETLAESIATHPRFTNPGHRPF